MEKIPDFMLAPKREEPDPKTKAFIEELVASGHVVTIFRSSKGRIFDCRVTGKVKSGRGKVEEVWCN